MSYLWNEKRFYINSNGFEFHVHPYRTGENLVKIGQYFFRRPERVLKKNSFSPKNFFYYFSQNWYHNTGSTTLHLTIGSSCLPVAGESHCSRQIKYILVPSGIYIYIYIYSMYELSALTSSPENVHNKI